MREAQRGNCPGRISRPFLVAQYAALWQTRGNLSLAPLPPEVRMICISIPVQSICRSCEPREAAEQERDSPEFARARRIVQQETDVKCGRGNFPSAPLSFHQAFLEADTPRTMDILAVAPNPLKACRV